MEYNYKQAVKADLLAAIEDDGIEINNMSAEELIDRYWAEDRVTGNGSGSYSFNTYEAEEFLCHNWDILMEAAEEFGYKVIDMNCGAEFWDVTIRCYMLMEVAGEICEE